MWFCGCCFGCIVGCICLCLWLGVWVWRLTFVIGGVLLLFGCLLLFIFIAILCVDFLIVCCGLVLGLLFWGLFVVVCVFVDGLGVLLLSVCFGL